MPRQGQKRELDKGLRKVVAWNVQRLMQGKLESATALGKTAGVGRRTVDRLLDCTTAANLDTLQAVAAALNVQPWELVFGGAARSVLERVFATPVPDARLGPAWTRPDKRKPLLQGGVAVDPGEAKAGNLTGIAFVALQHGAQYRGDITGRCRLLPVLAIGLLQALQKQVTDLL